MNRIQRYAVAVAATGLLAWGLAACGDLPIKQNLPPNIKKIYIPDFENKTNQPNIDTLLTQKVVQDFIVDGRLQVVPLAQADAELKGTIQRYDRLVLTRSADASQVPQQYKLQIAVDFDFINLHTGKLMWTTRSLVNMTPGMEPNPHQYDSMNPGSLVEFTNFYVINVLGVPPEDETHAQDRLLNQMADRVVRRTLDGF